MDSSVDTRATVARPEPAPGTIRAQIDLHDEHLGRLDYSVNALFARLTDILEDGVPTSADVPDARIGPRSPMASRLNGQNDNLSMQLNRLDELLSRIVIE